MENILTEWTKNWNLTITHSTSTNRQQRTGQVNNYQHEQNIIYTRWGERKPPWNCYLFYSNFPHFLSIHLFQIFFLGSPHANCFFHWWSSFCGLWNRIGRIMWMINQLEPWVKPWLRCFSVVFTPRYIIQY